MVTADINPPIYIYCSISMDCTSFLMHIADKTLLVLPEKNPKQKSLISKLDF